MKTKMTFLIMLLLSGNIYAAELISSVTVKGATHIGTLATRPYSSNSDAGLQKIAVLVLGNSVDLTDATVYLTYVKTVYGPDSVRGDFSNPVRVIATNSTGTKQMYMDLSVITIEPAFLPFYFENVQYWVNGASVGIGPVGTYSHPSNFNLYFSDPSSSLYFAFRDSCSLFKATVWKRTTALTWTEQDVFDIEWSTDGQAWTLAKRYDSTSPLFCSSLAGLSDPIEIEQAQISVPIDPTARYIRAKLVSIESKQSIWLTNAELEKSVETSVEQINMQRLKLYLRNDILTIQDERPVQEISLYSNNGSLVLFSENKSELNVNTLNKGAYIIKVKFDDNNSYMAKFIK